jgi:hypothetical protein
MTLCSIAGCGKNSDDNKNEDNVKKTTEADDISSYDKLESTDNGTNVISTETEEESQTQTSKKNDFDDQFGGLSDYIVAQYDVYSHLGENVIFRDAYIKLDDYYNYDYMNLDSIYFCLNVRPENSNDVWYVYADRTEFKDLYDLLIKNISSTYKTTLVAQCVFPDSVKAHMATLVAEKTTYKSYEEKNNEYLADLKVDTEKNFEKGTLDALKLAKKGYKTLYSETKEEQYAAKIEECDSKIEGILDKKYKNAETLLEEGKYSEAYKEFSTTLEYEYKDSLQKCNEIKLSHPFIVAEIGDVVQFGDLIGFDCWEGLDIGTNMAGKKIVSWEDSKLNNLTQESDNIAFSEWILLDRKDGKVLLLSTGVTSALSAYEVYDWEKYTGKLSTIDEYGRYIIRDEFRVYSCGELYTDISAFDNVVWEPVWILFDEVYSIAFSDEQKKRIQDNKNGRKWFLLNCEQAGQYLDILSKIYAFPSSIVLFEDGVGNVGNNGMEIITGEKLKKYMIRFGGSDMFNGAILPAMWVEE